MSVFIRTQLTALRSILEYLTREDADRAIRDLDSKELRGKIVRVADDSVSGTVLKIWRLVLKTLLALWSR